MAKSLYSKQKRSSQTFNEDVQDTDTRKKTKTSVADAGECLPRVFVKCSLSSTGLDVPSRRSARSNIGRGGQKAQMENIERIQTQNSTKVSKIAAAVANEPLNPMAPMALNARLPGSKESAVTESRTHPSTRPAPLPMYQASMEGSRYGFNATVEGQSPPLSSQGSFPLNSSDSRFVTSHTMRPHFPPVAVVPRHGSIVPTPRGPAARGSAIDASSRSGSTPTPSRVGSIVPSSRGGSVAPSSRSGSVAPSSRGGSVATQSSRAPPFGMSRPQRQMPSSLPVARTYSVAHSLEDMTHQLHPSLDISRPPPYQSRYEDHHAPGDGNEHEGDEPPIDEMSPDEDERVAEAALRGSNGHGARRIPDDSDIDPVLLTEESAGNRVRTIPEDHEIDPMPFNETNEEDSNFDSDTGDVVKEHHQRNRFPRPPDPSVLRDIRLQHHNLNANAKGKSRVQDRGASRAMSLLPQAPSSDVAPGPLDGPATKLRAYPVGFRPLIERAKLIAQCNCASIHPFLPRSEFLDRKSAEYFNEALAEIGNVSQGYWPQYRKELAILLWEAMMSWRSTLKAKAREIVPRFYTLGEELPVAENKANAQTLIRGSTFTFDGVDEEGSTNNMAAPALGALIVSFFYNGPSSLAAKFPDVFTGEVPEVTVCLAATALRAAIDEYTMTGAREDRKFEYQGYSKIYAQFYSMQLAINSDEKHAVKTRALRIAWANSADVPANDPGNIIAFEDDFQPILD